VVLGSNPVLASGDHGTRDRGQRHDRTGTAPAREHGGTGSSGHFGPTASRDSNTHPSTSGGRHSTVRRQSRLGRLLRRMSPRTRIVAGVALAAVAVGGAYQVGQVMAHDGPAVPNHSATAPAHPNTDGPATQNTTAPAQNLELSQLTQLQPALKAINTAHTAGFDAHNKMLLGSNEGTGDAAKLSEIAAGSAKDASAELKTLAPKLNATDRATALTAAGHLDEIAEGFATQQGQFGSASGITNPTFEQLQPLAYVTHSTGNSIKAQLLNVKTALGLPAGTAAPTYAAPAEIGSTTETQTETPSTTTTPSAPATPSTATPSATPTPGVPSATPTTTPSTTTTTTP